jgi:hydroxyacylglutathione hydrolase
MTGTSADNDRFYFRQLLSGRDFAVGDPIATQMVNFVYLIGDKSTGECVVVDPAYAVNELVDIAEADGMRVTGALGTHYHPDHVGGSMMGYKLEGAAALLERVGVKLHVQRDEAEFVRKVTGLTDADLVHHTGGDVLSVGAVDITFVHTPGHTPGSQCFLVNGCLVSGDTLFLEGCGRTDFPGSSPELMFESLTQLAKLPEETVVYPGHKYSMTSFGAMGSVRETNYVYRPKSREQWLTMFGS